MENASVSVIAIIELTLTFRQRQVLLDLICNF